MESAGKPGSVVDNHSSRMHVTVHLQQPTRIQRGPRLLPEGIRIPIWSCSEWGLPCRKLLPVARCALTAPFHPYLCPKNRAIGGLLSAALSVGSRPPGVTWHSALWSPDFPPPDTRCYSLREETRNRAAVAWPTPASRLAVFDRDTSVICFRQHHHRINRNRSIAPKPVEL